MKSILALKSETETWKRAAARHAREGHAQEKAKLFAEAETSYVSAAECYCEMGKTERNGDRIAARYYRAAARVTPDDSAYARYLKKAITIFKRYENNALIIDCYKGFLEREQDDVARAGLNQNIGNKYLAMDNPDYAQAMKHFRAVVDGTSDAAKKVHGMVKIIECMAGLKSSEQEMTKAFAEAQEYAGDDAKLKNKISAAKARIDRKPRWEKGGTRSSDLSSMHLRVFN